MEGDGTSGTIGQGPTDPESSEHFAKNKDKQIKPNKFEYFINIEF